MLLADVEKALAERSEYGIVGGDLIPDSCHFSFRGHWEAAQAILPVLEAALPEVIRRRRSDPARPITYDAMRQLHNHDPHRMRPYIRRLQGMVQAEENRRFLQERIDTYEEEISSFASNPQDRLGVLSAYCGRVKVCPCRAAYEMDALSLLPDQDPTASGRKLLSHCPQYAVVWIGSLTRLQSLQRWDELWTWSRAALELFPEAPGLWNNYAVSAEHLGRIDQVAREFQDWLRRYPWSAEFWYCYGNLVWQRNQIRTAADAWLTALLMNPPQILALARLAELPSKQLNPDIHRLPARVVNPVMVPFVLACVDYLQDRLEVSGSVDGGSKAPPAADPEKAERIRETLAQTPFNAPAYWRDLTRQAARTLELEQRTVSAGAMRDLADLFNTFAVPH